ncbi:F-box only protein 48 [Cyclopterus lumpus]|uniref:F-box protein 48 n=1 Tax=Cyclopterus lumpus TaxID=8103 RepID=A0A8C2ZCE9_CYCLU|nr:F-box only protein 48 [Cyclopterus lumpus]
MQHDPTTRTSPVFVVSKRRASLMPDADADADADAPGKNFAETLPTEMSVKIFGELDAGSLCSASRVCRLWHRIIEGSDQVWRRPCLPVAAVCQREVDGDRRDGLTWKVTLVKNYTRSCVKRDWLRGRYSHVRSAGELIGRKMAPLDAETWGEILQAELDR